jgi:hypothetical protein
MDTKIGNYEQYKRYESTMLLLKIDLHELSTVIKKWDCDPNSYKKKEDIYYKKLNLQTKQLLKKLLNNNLNWIEEKYNIFYDNFDDLIRSFIIQAKLKLFNNCDNDSINSLKRFFKKFSNNNLLLLLKKNDYNNIIKILENNYNQDFTFFIYLSQYYNDYLYKIYDINKKILVKKFKITILLLNKVLNKYDFNPELKELDIIINEIDEHFKEKDINDNIKSRLKKDKLFINQDELINVYEELCIIRKKFVILRNKTFNKKENLDELNKIYEEMQNFLREMNEKYIPSDKNYERKEIDDDKNKLFEIVANTINIIKFNTQIDSEKLKILLGKTMHLNEFIDNKERDYIRLKSLNNGSNSYHM